MYYEFTLTASYQGPIDRDLDNKVAEIVADKYDGSGHDLDDIERDHFWFALSLEEMTSAMQELSGLDRRFRFQIHS